MKVRLKIDFIVQIRDISRTNNTIINYGFKEKTIKANTEFDVVSYQPFMSVSNSCDRIMGSGVIIKNEDLDLVVSLEEFNILFEEVK
jgi:hypothetical protein